MAKGCAIVLAGGQSRRMGRDKAWLEVAGEPLLLRVLRRLAPSFDVLILVAAPGQSLPPIDTTISVLAGQEPQPKGAHSFSARGVSRLTVLRDEYPGKGPLAGMYTGLKACDTDYCPVVACDVPFVNAELLVFMVTLARREGCEAVVPVVNDKMQPLHGVYSKGLWPAMGEALTGRSLALHSFLDGKRVRYVTDKELVSFDPQLLFELNINTPEDLQEAERLVRTLGVVQ